jgi:hypothetical protein
MTIRGRYGTSPFKAFAGQRDVGFGTAMKGSIPAILDACAMTEQF